MAYSWLAPDAVQFILSRALVGTGYGLALMASQGFVVIVGGAKRKASGLANMFAGYETGIRIFDTCTGGLGGCPFVKGAAGNIPTEDAVHMFESMGIATGIAIDRLCEAVVFLESKLDRQLPGHMKRVLEHRRSCE